MTGNPKLIILSKNLRGQSFVLEQETYTVGRVDSNDVCLPDGTISTHHASIVKDSDGGYSVRDNGSTNGTRINGTRVTEQKLSSGDVLQFGGIEALYDSGDDNMTTANVTHTAIDITKTAGSIQISDDMINISPLNSGGSKKQENKMMKYLFPTVITVLVVAIVGLTAWLVMELMNGG